MSLLNVFFILAGIISVVLSAGLGAPSPSHLPPSPYNLSISISARDWKELNKNPARGDKYPISFAINATSYSDCEISVHGANSRHFSKKSFLIKFVEPFLCPRPPRLASPRHIYCLLFHVPFYISPESLWALRFFAGLDVSSRVSTFLDVL